MSENEHTPDPILVRLIKDQRQWEKPLPAIAIVISLFAFAVSCLGAYWSQRNYKLSVVPLITVWHEPDPSKPGIHWKLKNAGLGPAKVRDIALFVNKQRGKDNIAKDTHWQDLKSATGDKLRVNWGKLLVPGEGMRAGDEIQPFSLEMEQFDVDTLAILAICYCSLYEQCWYTDSRVYSGPAIDPLIKQCP